MFVRWTQYTTSTAPCAGDRISNRLEIASLDGQFDVREVCDPPKEPLLWITTVMKRGSSVSEHAYVSEPDRNETAIIDAAYLFRRMM